MTIRDAVRLLDSRGAPARRKSSIYRTAEVADFSFSSLRLIPVRRCDRPDCGAEFVVTHPQKRFCSSRCQRIAERRRYRHRHTAEARCRRCGATFKRTTTTERLQVYCTTKCQYEARAAEYPKRADILAGMARARAARRENA